MPRSLRCKTELWFVLVKIFFLFFWFYSLVSALTLPNCERQQYENSSFVVSHRVDWHIFNVLLELAASTVSWVRVRFQHHTGERRKSLTWTAHIIAFSAPVRWLERLKVDTVPGVVIRISTGYIRTLLPGSFVGSYFLWPSVGYIAFQSSEVSW